MSITEITDSELALAAAEAGAAVVRTLYGSSLDRFDKSPGDFATSADIAAEQAILEVLRAARPDDALVGEESGHTGVSERVWLVDPLCGTLNYAVQTPLVAVNVALRSEGSFIAAASVDPLAGEAFWTDGSGAWLRRDGGDDIPLTPSADSFLVEINLDPPFPRFVPTRMIADPLFGKTFGPRVISSTLGLAWLASGRRAAYVTDGGDLRDSVHFAAGVALCQAAGCVVTGIRGEPLDSGPGGLLAAADPETHQALLAIVTAG